MKTVYIIKSAVIHEVTTISENKRDAEEAVYRCLREEISNGMRIVDRTEEESNNAVTDFINPDGVCITRIAALRLSGKLRPGNAGAGQL